MPRLLELIRFLAWSAAWTPRFPIWREEGFKREIKEPKKEMKRNAIKHFTEITFETELIPDPIEFCERIEREKKGDR